MEDRRTDCCTVVNFIGCARVVDALETSYSKEYAHASVHNFTASDGSLSGWTKSAGKGAGNLAFVAFANAGHMVSTHFSSCVLGGGRLSAVRQPRCALGKG